MLNMGFSTSVGVFVVIFWIKHAESQYPLLRTNATPVVEETQADDSPFPEIRCHTDNQSKSHMRSPGPKSDTSGVPRSPRQTTHSDHDSSQNYSQLTNHQTYSTQGPGQENTPYLQLTPHGLERHDHVWQLTLDQSGAESWSVRL
ncbi:uncharacterized protein LOC127840137 isoform X2 [Dreissena polymorpha]|uniref:uncharacterized protein LOC127840137 isoform X2 n=1 Tax=Dreissena polymorpha TaxID=45954 RepID=UPI0022651F8E|nr:uncharacterized protein LOC127840137 isoform X2 [Dreissena polymorpha]